ncbi:MAG: hypothetical protein JXK16_06800 [Thiotrichales bacterium]|nr:hypothetical protein [Thiotrichales bacterium]
MLFFLLFSSLSSQWAGASTLNKNTDESKAVSTVAVESSHVHMHHAVDHTNTNHNHQQAHESHDCCPSMNTSAEKTFTPCAYCGDNCQCASGQTCQHISPVVNFDSPSISAGLLSSVTTASYTPLLVSVAISPEFKPPQA